jgi:hypothetical protein
MQASTEEAKNRKKLIVRIALVLAIIGLTAVVVIRWDINSIANLRTAARTTADSGRKIRVELLELYVRRVELASRLLKLISAPPLNPSWTRVEDWRADTAEDLAALDRDQNQISNHLAQYMSKIQIYGEPQKRKTGKVPGKEMEELIKQAQNFERFEQDIVRKRREYTLTAASFAEQFKDARNRESLKRDPDFSNERFPQFPAEIELQRSVERKAAAGAKEKN